MKTESYPSTTYDHIHVQPRLREVTKTGEDTGDSPRVEIIVVEPRGDFWDMSPKAEQLEHVANHTCTCERVGGSRGCRCVDLPRNESGVLPGSNVCQEDSNGFTDDGAGGEQCTKTEEEDDLPTGYCPGWELPEDNYRLPYIVVAPTTGEKREELIVKNELSAITDADMNDSDVMHLSCQASPFFSTAHVKVSASFTDLHNGNPTGMTSDDVEAVCYVDIPRTCRIPVVIPPILFRYPAEGHTIRSYFVTVTYNHAGDIIQLDTRFDRVPEGRYFVVASKPNFPSEIETAVVHGYLVPAAPGGRPHAPDTNFAIVDIEYPRSDGTLAAPNESNITTDRRRQVNCVSKIYKKGKARWSRDWKLPRRKRTPAIGNHTSGDRTGLKSPSACAARGADISVFMCRAVQTDRVKYTRVIMRLANELGVAACVHQLLNSVRHARFERHYMDAILETLVDVGRANESRGISVVYETSAQLHEICETPEASTDHYSTTLTKLLQTEIGNAYFHKKHNFTLVGGPSLTRSPESTKLY